MKNVLFKGKSILTKEWIYGSLIFNDKNRPYIVENFNSDTKEYNTISVYPETVCQYTGLLDKRGYPIFENDIVQTNRGVPHKIFWNESESKFEMTNAWAMSMSTIQMGEVITNAIDTPDWDIKCERGNIFATN